MQEAIDVAKELRAMPDLLPWVIFVVVCIVLWANKGLVMEYIKARIGYWKSMKDVNAVLPEVIRNNTAAMNLCTEAFRDWKADRGENRRLLQFHEQASAERMQHIQEVVNRIDATVTSNSKSIGLIEDRTG